MMAPMRAPRITERTVNSASRPPLYTFWSQWRSRASASSNLLTGFSSMVSPSPKMRREVAYRGGGG